MGLPAQFSLNSDVNKNWVVITDISNEEELKQCLTVTNDVERVVSKANENYPNRRIAYFDSEGELSELLHKDGVFEGFGDTLTLPLG